MYLDNEKRINSDWRHKYSELDSENIALKSKIDEVGRSFEAQDTGYVVFKFLARCQNRSTRERKPDVNLE